MRPGTQRGRGPSQADVALHAGVSGQTVSRVSNGSANVDVETREKVLRSMAALGYRPNRAARALRSGRFRSIGVIMFGLDSFGNMRTLNAIANSAATAGYSVALVTVRAPSQESVSAAFDELLGQSIDGIVIVIDALLADTAVATIPRGLPVVVLDSRERQDYPVVDIDQAGGARLAVEHLLSLGHETVFHISGPDRSFSALSRRAAWEQTLRGHGRRVPEVVAGDWSSRSGYEGGLRLASDPEVTAVFAANDQMALGLLRALHEVGRLVPEEISVVGFDDGPDAECYWPPLTTVQQTFGEVGRRSVEMLIAEIEGQGPQPGVTLVETRLVIRDSTGPAA